MFLGNPDRLLFSVPADRGALGQAVANACWPGILEGTDGYASRNAAIGSILAARRAGM